MPGLGGGRRGGRDRGRNDERQPTDRTLAGLSGLSRIGLQDVRALGTSKLKHVVIPPDRFVDATGDRSGSTKGLAVTIIK